MKHKRSFILVLIGSLLLSAVSILSYVPTSIAEALGAQSSEASSDTQYPVQEVLIVGATDRNLAIQEQDNSHIHTEPSTGESNERWRLSTSDGVYFQIINMNTNTPLSQYDLMAPTDSLDHVETDTSDDSQLWQFVGADQDAYGDFYNYTIVSKNDSNLVLTEETSNNILTLSNYIGSTNQKWKLNSSGIVGYAGFVEHNGKMKTGTIGGLLGETVEVRDYPSLKKALDDDLPRTIIVAANIDLSVEPVVTKIGSNKTIIGSYAAHTLTNPRLITDDPYGVTGVSNNIILKNLNIEVDNRPGLINLSVYGSRNLWVDHCTFNSNMPVDVNEVGKYIWVNYSGNQDLDPDYYTISYSKFSNRYWAVTFGAKSIDQNNATVAYNYFDSCVRRTPETGNGRLHALNNFIERDNSYEDRPYAAILGAYEAHTYSEANRFENFHKLSTGYWDKELMSTYVNDVGSYTDSGVTSTATPYAYQTYATDVITSYNPSADYSYKVIQAYDGVNGNDVKTFNTAHAGSVSNDTDLKYVEYPEFAHYLLHR
ncbi:pectate lyase family protein [Paenibacillus xylanexedens]|uniref:pectate lyase family protein n=1 Tax=Paenibacillus xylanexedens TaxID=528191 RepID=UPI0016424B3B|nr:pectate lyase-like adhesive domain-containing protein [Paenibacillus xylanexedens]